MMLILDALAAEITHQPEIQLTDSNVRLERVVQLEGAEAKRIGQTVIARLPDGPISMDLSRDQIRSLAMRAVPGLVVEQAPEGAIRFIRAAKPAALSGPCYEVAVAVPAGQPVTPADVAVVPCDQQRDAASVRLDLANGSLLAGEALAQGTYVGSARLTDPPAVRRGEMLTLRSQSGPVIIERPVVAMQASSQAEGRIFVRTDDGQVFATDVSTERGQ